MRNRLLSAAMSLGLILLMFAFGSASTVSVSSPEGASRDLSTLEGTLEDWSVQSLDQLEPLPDGALAVLVELDHSEYVLALKPYSMRDVNFRVQVQVESGELVDFIPPPPATYRGEVAGIPGSVVAASLINGQLKAMIDLGTEDNWFIEPLSDYDSNADLSEHVIYRSSETIPTNRICGNSLFDLRQPIDFDLEAESMGGYGSYGIGDPGLDPMQNDEIADIAFDADYEFFQKNASNVGLTVADIEDVLNGVEVVYQRDVEICYNITHIIVRSSINDPYTSNDAETLLNQFRSEWNANQGAIDRDLAHMMTGRNMNGGTIGIAWLSVVCSRLYGYGLSESRYTSNFNHRIALTAHETGHNWSAQHCNGNGDCHIMCSMINGCNGVGLPNFGFQAVGEITNHKNSRTCLDDGCGEVLDLIEPDPGIAGQANTIAVRGATSGATVEFFFSLTSGSSDVPGCTGLTLDLANARSLAVVTANSDGIATLTLMVPNGAAGRTIRLQAADETNCEISDVEVYPFP